MFHQFATGTNEGFIYKSDDNNRTARQQLTQSTVGRAETEVSHLEGGRGEGGHLDLCNSIHQTQRLLMYTMEYILSCSTVLVTSADGETEEWMPRVKDVILM